MPTTTNSSTDYLEFVEILEKLKGVKREGWRKRGIIDGESVPDHMYRMAMMALTVPSIPEGVDRERAVKMCLVHDLAEAIVGDITPECGISHSQKQQLEFNAMTCITSKLPKEQAEILKELFEEYEAGKSVTAKFVKDLDRIEFLLQAKTYIARYGKEFPDFFENTVGKIYFKELLAFFNL